jgi:predicted GNAT family acetyltransferase
VIDRLLDPTPARRHIDVVHNLRRSRFEARVDELLCVADYQLVGNAMWMTHTGVPPSLREQGIADQLVAAAFAHARQNSLKVRPFCSFVRTYLRRHPMDSDLVASGSPDDD